MPGNPVRLARRNNGGIHLIQGGSFVLLSRDEAIQLIKDMQNMIDDRPQAETTYGNKH